MDREKVIKGLNCCCHTDGSNCAKCPYDIADSDCTALMSMDVLAMLKDQPEVVRCKDCAYWQDNNGGYPHKCCRWNQDETPDPDDYCSGGVPKD